MVMLVVEAVKVSVQGVEVSVGATTVPLSTVIVVGAPSVAVVVALAELEDAPSAGMTPGPTTLIGGTGPVEDAAGGAGAAFAGVSALPPPVAGILDDPITRMGGAAPLEELAAGADADDDVDAALVEEAACELSAAAPLEITPTPITLIGTPAVADELAGEGVAEADAPTLVAPITLT